MIGLVSTAALLARAGVADEVRVESTAWPARPLLCAAAFVRFAACPFVTAPAAACRPAIPAPAAVDAFCTAVCVGAGTGGVGCFAAVAFAAAAAAAEEEAVAAAAEAEACA